MAPELPEHRTLADSQCRQRVAVAIYDLQTVILVQIQRGQLVVPAVQGGQLSEEADALERRDIPAVAVELGHGVQLGYRKKTVAVGIKGLDTGAEVGVREVGGVDGQTVCLRQDHRVGRNTKVIVSKLIPGIHPVDFLRSLQYSLPDRRNFADIQDRQRVSICAGKIRQFCVAAQIQVRYFCIQTFQRKQLGVVRYVQERNVVVAAVQIGQVRIAADVESGKIILVTYEAFKLGVFRHVQGTQLVSVTVKDLQVRSVPDIQGSDLIRVAIDPFQLFAFCKVQRRDLVVDTVDALELRILIHAQHCQLIAGATQLFQACILADVQRCQLVFIAVQFRERRKILDAFQAFDGIAFAVDLVDLGAFRVAQNIVTVCVILLDKGPKISVREVGGINGHVGGLGGQPQGREQPQHQRQGKQKRKHFFHRSHLGSSFGCREGVFHGQGFGYRHRGILPIVL